MKFKSMNIVKLVNIRTFTSKAGNPCTFLTLADTSTYENADFMPLKGFDVSSLQIGKDYIAELDVQRYTAVSLTPVPVK